MEITINGEIIINKVITIHKDISKGFSKDQAIQLPRKELSATKDISRGTRGTNSKDM